MMVSILVLAAMQPAGATAAPPPEPAVAYAPVPPGFERSRDYQAYRGCLDREVKAAAEMGTVPEDLLPQLHLACRDERAAIVAMAERRPGRSRDEDETARSSIVDRWTDHLFVRAIRRYEIHYTTGLPLRE